MTSAIQIQTEIVIQRKDKDKDNDNDKDKDANRITETVLMCYIFGILMTQAFNV